jgi:hypothetical protein
LERRSREAVEKQNDRCVWIAGFTIENADAIGFKAFAMDQRNFGFVAYGCG